MIRTDRRARVADPHAILRVFYASLAFMQIRSIAAVAIVAGVWAACQALSTIQLHEEATTTIQRGTLIEEFLGDVGFGEFLDMDLMQSTELQNQGVQPGDVREVYVTGLVLEVTSPEGGDLSFIDSLAFYVEADGMRERIAFQDDFPEGASIVEMNMDDVDIAEFVVAESMDIVTEVTAHRPPDDTDVLAQIDIAVGVTAQGACNAIK